MILTSAQNTILAEFRRSAPFDIKTAAAWEFGWLAAGCRPIPATASSAEVDHALKVFWRLGRQPAGVQANGGDRG